MLLPKYQFCSSRMNIRFVIMSDNVLLDLMVLCPQVQLKSDSLANRNKKIIAK